MKNIDKIYYNLKNSFGVLFNDVQFEIVNDDIFAYNINNKNIKTKLNLKSEEVLYTQLMDLALYGNTNAHALNYNDAKEIYNKYEFDKATSQEDLKNKYINVINDYKNK